MKKLNPSEKIIGTDNLTVGDFWIWAYSDILSNRNRSIFAEFLVGSALEVLDKPRLEWDAVDLRYNGKKIEVKSAAYIQSWKQSRLSTISFDISMKSAWDAETNTYTLEPLRSADCYVFCLFKEVDNEAARVQILNVNAWEFFVCSSEQVGQTFGNQRSVRLSRIQTLCDSVDYQSLKYQIDFILSL